VSCDFISISYHFFKSCRHIYL